MIIQKIFNPYINLTLGLIAYGVLYVAFGISLTGYWTDAVFVVAFVIFNFAYILKVNKPEFQNSRGFALVINSFMFVFFLVFTVYHIVSATQYDQKVDWLKVDGQYYNVHYRPDFDRNDRATAGTIRIYRSPKAFPVVEYSVYVCDTITNSKTYGKPLNEEQVIARARTIIEEEAL